MMRVNESIFAVDFVVQDGAVYCHRRDSVEVIRPWGERAGAWRCSLGRGDIQPFSPEFHIGSLEEIVLSEGRGGRLLPSRRRQLNAFQFLLDSWPEAVRRCVRRFASSHWQLIQFVNRCGVGAEQLLWSNPTLGFMAANVALAFTPGLGVNSVESLHHILGMKRRTMVARFGFSEKEGVVRLLGKVSAGWVSLDFLASLRGLLEVGGEAACLLTYMPRVNPLIVEMVRDPEIRSMFSFECLRQAAMIGPSAIHCDVIARVKEAACTARRLNLRLPHFNQLSDIDRSPALLAPRTASRSGSRLRVFPSPPLPEFPGIQAIRTPADLMAEGRRMRHCAGTRQAYAEEVIGGSLFFYRLLEPERATICIRKRNESWLLDDVRGPANKSVGGPTLTVIQDWLRRSHRAAPPGSHTRDDTPIDDHGPSHLRGPRPYQQLLFLFAEG